MMVWFSLTHPCIVKAKRGVFFVDYRENLAAVLRLIKEESSLSVTEFARKLDISRSQLVEFLKERGNPRMDTVLHISEKLGIDPAEFFAPPFRPKQHPVLELMLQAHILLRDVAPQNRPAFVDHFTQMLLLMEEA